VIGKYFWIVLLVALLAMATVVPTFAARGIIWGD